MTTISYLSLNTPKYKKECWDCSEWKHSTNQMRRLNNFTDACKFYCFSFSFIKCFFFFFSFGKRQTYSEFNMLNLSDAIIDNALLYLWRMWMSFITLITKHSFNLWFVHFFLNFCLRFHLFYPMYYDDSCTVSVGINKAK